MRYNESMGRLLYLLAQLGIKSALHEWLMNYGMTWTKPRRPGPK